MKHWIIIPVVLAGASTAALGAPPSVAADGLRSEQVRGLRAAGRAVLGARRAEARAARDAGVGDEVRGLVQELRVLSREGLTPQAGAVVTVEGTGTGRQRDAAGRVQARRQADQRRVQTAFGRLKQARTRMALSRESERRSKRQAHLQRLATKLDGLENEVLRLLEEPSDKRAKGLNRLLRRLERRRVPAEVSAAEAPTLSTNVRHRR